VATGVLHIGGDQLPGRRRLPAVGRGGAAGLVEARAARH